jgi:hypothetical protein
LCKAVCCVSFTLNINACQTSNDKTLDSNAITQLVEALRYKPECCGFDSRWGFWNSSVTETFRPQYGPGVDSAFNRNENQGSPLGSTCGRAYGWQICHLYVVTIWKSWESHPPEALGTYIGLYKDSFTHAGKLSCGVFWYAEQQAVLRPSRQITYTRSGVVRMFYIIRGVTEC